MGWMKRCSLDGVGSKRSRWPAGLAARWLMGLLLCWIMAAGMAVAQAPASNQADRIAALEKAAGESAAAAAKAQSAGDNAWMLTSAALVLMMSGPGLALFYGGLVRKKNILGTMMQTFAMMAVITVLWAFVTYSLAFGSGNAFIGGLHNVFLRGVGLEPNPFYAATIPLQTYMVYQLMFAIITPALITGAFAERMKFSAMLVFMVLWAILVYSPMAHMVWGVGRLVKCCRCRNGRTCGAFSLPGLCWWNGRACDLGRERAGNGAIPGQASGISPEGVHAALGCAELYWSLPSVGWLVWIQRRVGAGSQRLGNLGVRGHALWSGSSCDWLVGGRVAAQWEAFSAGSDLGRRGGAGCDHAGFGLCEPDERSVDRPVRRYLLLLHGGEGKKYLWLR